MNWLKNQKNKRKPHTGGVHKATASDRIVAPEPTPQLNRSQSESAATAVTSPREPTLSQSPNGGHMMLAMCDDFVQSQRNQGHMQRNALFAASRQHSQWSTPYSNKIASSRKTTDSFAAQLNEFNTDDLADLSYSEEEDTQLIDNNDDTNTSKQTKQSVGSFAAHLSQFVGHGAGDLDAIVDAIHDDDKDDDDQIYNGLYTPSYKDRLSKYKRNRRVRSGTIVQLKKELALSESGKKVHIPNMKRTKNMYKKRTKIYNAKIPKRVAFTFDEEDEESTTSSPKPSSTGASTGTSCTSFTLTDVTESQKDVSVFSPPPNYNILSPHNKMKKYTSLITVDPALNEWYQYLIASHQYLIEHVQYFSLIGDKMPSIAEQTASGDSHAIERTLILKMRQWIQRYGIPAMVSHQEVFALKRNLIKSNEEANNLEEESVQLTQKMFGLENQVQLLNDTTQKQENQIEILNKAIQSYKNDIKRLNNKIRELQRPVSVSSLRLSPIVRSARLSPKTPPPPPHTRRSPSPIPLKQSYSMNMLDVDGPFDLDRPRSHPIHKNRLKPIPPPPSSPPRSKTKSCDELMNHNDYLATELNALQNKYQRESNSKSVLEVEVAVLKRALSENGVQTESNTLLTNNKKKKNRKSLINFGRKTNSTEINEDLTKVINEMSQQKYVWESEKNALKEEIQELKEKVKLLSKGNTTPIIPKDENMEEKTVKSPPWKPGSFGDHLNSFIVDDATGLDGILNAISNEQFDVEHELTENELSQMEYIEDNEEKSGNIVVTAEIDEYENSDDGWVSDNITDSIQLSQSTTQSITTSSVTTTANSAPLNRRMAKITKVMIPSNNKIIKDRSRSGGFNSLFSKIKTMPRKKLPPAPTTVIADVKRMKKRFFHPTKHGALCVDSSTLWHESIVSKHPTFYVAIDGLPSSTNIDRNESDWKKQKQNDILVPFMCFFSNKSSFDDLMTQTAHKSVRDILFQKRFAQFCDALIRLDTANVHWDLKTLLKSLDIDREMTFNCNDTDNKLFIASNVDSDDKECIDIHSVLCENEQSRNQWLSAIQGMIDRRRQSVNRRSAHGTPASGRYKMKLF